MLVVPVVQADLLPCRTRRMRRKSAEAWHGMRAEAWRSSGAIQGGAQASPLPSDTTYLCCTLLYAIPLNNFFYIYRNPSVPFSVAVMQNTVPIRPQASPRLLSSPLPCTARSAFRNPRTPPTARSELLHTATLVTQPCSGASAGGAAAAAPAAGAAGAPCTAAALGPCAPRATHTGFFFVAAHRCTLPSQPPVIHSFEVTKRMQSMARS